MTVSLNTCDICITLFESGLFNKAYNEVCEAYGLPIEKMYIGSYFCDWYFLNISDLMIDEFVRFAKEKHMKVTLVIPTPSENNLVAVKNKIKVFTDKLGNDLVSYTVNDFGMLVYVDQKYKKHINLGRLMHKDVRDCRYDTVLTPKSKIEICSEDMNTIIAKYRIQGIEIENLISTREIENAYEYRIMLHTPLVMATTGRVCEFASISLPDNKKFRSSMVCNRPCTKCMESFLNESSRYYKIGRTVFYTQEASDIYESDIQDIIVFPMRTIIEYYENTSTFK